jgi:hypothetical protein
LGSDITPQSAIVLLRRRHHKHVSSMVAFLSDGFDLLPERLELHGEVHRRLNRQVQRRSVRRRTGPKAHAREI